MLLHLLLFALVLSGGNICQGQTETPACNVYCPPVNPGDGICVKTCEDDSYCNQELCCPNSCGGKSCMAAYETVCSDISATDCPCKEYEVCVKVENCPKMRCVPVDYYSVYY
ncbi:hypothetical protein ACOMHN_010746 [Nucella lapillus]